jgi:RHS repeat-associated protein
VAQGTSYYLHDGLNSVRNLLDASQAVQNSYDYDAWGAILAAVETVGNDYTFTGRQADRENFLYYFRARMYDPLSARFTQTDPIDDNWARSLNIYTDNNPTNFVDPLGTCTKSGGASTPGIGATFKAIFKGLYNSFSNSSHGSNGPASPSSGTTAVKG